MANRYHFVQENELVKLVVTCVDSLGVVINLTGCTAQIRWKTSDGTIVDKDMSIESAVEGKASYQFQTGELTPPTMTYEVTVTTPGDVIMSSLTAEVLGVRARLSI